MKQITEHTREKITLLLKGQLSGEEKVEWENKIAESKVLKEEAELISIGFQVSLQQRRKRAEQILQEVANPSTPGFKFQWIPNLSAAAVLIGILCLFGFWKSQQNILTSPQLAAIHFFPAENSLSEMAPSTLDPTLEKGLRYYDTQRYQEALTTFALIPSNDSLYFHKRFYEGNSWLALEKVDSALVAFQEVYTAQNDILKENAQWYLALCYLYQDNPRQATQELNQLKQSNGNFKFKADQLLAKVNRVPSDQ